MDDVLTKKLIDVTASITNNLNSVQSRVEIIEKKLESSLRAYNDALDASIKKSDETLSVLESKLRNDLESGDARVTSKIEPLFSELNALRETMAAESKTRTQQILAEITPLKEALARETDAREAASQQNLKDLAAAVKSVHDIIENSEATLQNRLTALEGSVSLARTEAAAARSAAEGRDTAITERLDSLSASMDAKIDSVNKNAVQRIDNLEATLSDITTDLNRKITNMEGNVKTSLDKKLTTATAALEKKIETSIDVLDKSLAEKKTELTQRMQNVEGEVAAQKSSLKSIMDVEITAATTQLKGTIEKELQDSVAEASARLTKEHQDDKVRLAGEMADLRNAMARTRGEITKDILRTTEVAKFAALKAQTIEKDATAREANLEQRLQDQINTRLLKESGRLNEINARIRDIIQRVESERESMRKEITTIVEQQISERKVFEKIDSQIAYIENLIGLQNAGFEERLQKEVGAAISQHANEANKELSELRRAVGETRTRMETELTETRRNLEESIKTASTVTSEQTQKIREQLEDELASAKTKMRNELDDYRHELDDSSIKTMNERFRMLDAKIDERFTNMNRNLTSRVHEILTQEAEDVALARVENMLNTLSNDLEAKKQEIAKEVHAIQANAVANVTQLAAQLQEESARMRSELEEVDRLKARIAADLERMEGLDSREIMLRLERLEAAINELREPPRPREARGPIILE